MKITVNEIIERLHGLWPNLNQIWCFDQEYDLPTKDEAVGYLKNNPFNISVIRAENPDCDDFALQYHAQIKRVCNWSCGEVFVNKYGGFRALHNLNICICQECILMIDPKKNINWEAASPEDNALWVRL